MRSGVRGRAPWAAAGVAVAVGVTSAGVWYAKSNDGRSRAPASIEKRDQQTPQGKTLAEAQAEVNRINANRKKAKEWAWAEEGEMDLVIEAYDKIVVKGVHGGDEKNRILAAIARTVKPRSEWPKKLNDAKVQKVIAFLERALNDDGPTVGQEAIGAVNALTAYAVALPDYRKKIEGILVPYYGREKRLGPKGAALDALSKFQSLKAIPLLRAAVGSKEHATSRTAIYSLANYLEGPHSKVPRQILLDLAKNDKGTRALAAKLLAFHGNREVASVVPQLLKEGAGAADIEAGAFVIERLQLKKYVGLLQRHRGSGAPFSAQQIDAAIKSAEKGSDK